MKSFIEFTAHEPLEEGFIKSASILAYANRARTEANNAKKAYDRGKSVLRGDSSGTVDLEVRLGRVEKAFEALFDGLAHSEAHMGYAVAANITGHMLTGSGVKRIRDKHRGR